jgi:hypothetical protein
LKEIKELKAGGMARNRHTGRYLLPNCYQNSKVFNQVGQGAEPWGDQPWQFSQLPHLKKDSAKISALELQPSLKEWQIALASLYARAVPPRSRPKRMSHSHAIRLSGSKKRLRSSSIWG